MSGAGHAHGTEHGDSGPRNKRVALLISVFAIVLASAAIITGIGALIWIAAGLGVVGIVFCTIGFFAPTAVHLF